MKERDQTNWSTPSLSLSLSFQTGIKVVTSSSPSSIPRKYKRCKCLYVAVVAKNRQLSITRSSYKLVGTFGKGVNRSFSQPRLICNGGMC